MMALSYDKQVYSWYLFRFLKIINLFKKINIYIGVMD